MQRSPSIHSHFNYHDNDISEYKTVTPWQNDKKTNCIIRSITGGNEAGDDALPTVDESALVRGVGAEVAGAAAAVAVEAGARDSLLSPGDHLFTLGLQSWLGVCQQTLRVLTCSMELHQEVLQVQT